MEYRVNVRRILREDTNVYIDADSPGEAAKKAKLEALREGAEWNCYDSEYWVDIDEDVEEI